MKNNTLKLSFSTVGCFFGAGLISGSELWQFFGCFGKSGIIGLMLSCFILSLLVYMTAYISHFGNENDVAHIMIPFKSEILYKTVRICESSFCFCIFTVMTAGATSLFGSFLSKSALLFIFSFVFSVTAAIISSKGFSCTSKLFSVIVPIMIVCATVTVLLSVLYDKNRIISTLPLSAEKNAFLKSLPVSSTVYAAYNFLCSVGTVSSSGKILKGKKDLVFSSAVCFIMLFSVSSGLICAMLFHPESVAGDLPLLVLAGGISPFLFVICAAGLLTAMFGASVGVLTSVIKSAEKIPLFKGRKSAAALAIAITAFIISRFGFRDLISTVYPIFGYISFLGMIGVTVNYIKQCFSCKIIM